MASLTKGFDKKVLGNNLKKIIEIFHCVLKLWTFDGLGTFFNVTLKKWASKL